MEIGLVSENAIYRLVEGHRLTFYHSEKKVELTQEMPEAICPYADASPTCIARPA